MSATAEAAAEVAAAPLAVRLARGMHGLSTLACTPAGATGLALTGAFAAAALVGPSLAPYDPFSVTGPSLAAPSAAHPLGTDALGRDLASGVLHGARTSLLVAALVAALAFVIGTGIGLVAGYAGGHIDDALMRMAELVQVLPRFFLAAVVIAFLGPGLDRLVLVLGVTSWPVLARVVRTETLSLRHVEFVRAAEALGAGPLRILLRELLPNVLPGTLVLLGLLIGQVMLLEAALSFIGLGDPGTMSWGALAGQAQGFIRTAWWLPLFPGLAICAAVLGINLLSDAAARDVGRQ